MMILTIWRLPVTGATTPRQTRLPMKNSKKPDRFSNKYDKTALTAYLVTKAAVTHKSPAGIIGELVRGELIRGAEPVMTGK
jgi:hypothetical protein